MASRPASYFICEELQTGWLQSYPDPGTADCSDVAGAGPEGYYIEDLATTEHIEDKDFGNFEGATISGLKFDDQEDPKGTNAADPDDPGLEGWTIQAYEDDGTGAATGSPVATAVTDADGNYTLTVPAGDPDPIDYVICEVLQAGWAQSAPSGPTDCGAVSGADFGIAVSAAVGDELTVEDFGNYRTADGHGQQDVLGRHHHHAGDGEARVHERRRQPGDRHGLAGEPGRVRGRAVRRRRHV